jgi:ElaB/YqjD/DUF883 family membrane-anchored ribosome-binding protein
MRADEDSASCASPDTAASLLAWLGSTRSKVADVAQRAESSTEAARRATVTYVERFPYQTVAMAVAFGFLIGILWSRR